MNKESKVTLFLLFFVFSVSAFLNTYADNEFANTNSALYSSDYSEKVRYENINSQQRAQNASFAVPSAAWSIQDNLYISSEANYTDIEAKQQAYNAGLAVTPPSRAIESNDYMSAISRNIDIESQQEAYNANIQMPPPSRSEQLQAHMSVSSRGADNVARPPAYNNILTKPALLRPEEPGQSMILVSQDEVKVATRRPRDTSYLPSGSVWKDSANPYEEPGNILIDVGPFPKDTEGGFKDYPKAARDTVE